MNKKRIVLATSLAILMAPSVLSSVDSVAHVAEPISAQAATTTPTVGTVGYAVRLVDINGKPNGVILPAGSSWQLGKLVTINGNSYYQVATNEYAEAIVMKQAAPVSTNSETTTVNTVVTVSADEVTIFNDDATATGQMLPVGSSWKADQVKVIGTNRYYRVATNEWIKISHTEDSKTITPTLKSDERVYNTATGTMGRLLPGGSSWQVSQVVRNSKNEFWGRVSTVEWIKLDASQVSMSYGDSDSVPSIATSDPNFALNAEQSEQNNNTTVTATLKYDEKLYDMSTNTLSRSLPAGSSWRIDSVVRNSKGVFWGRVSTNEWLKLDDGRVQTVNSDNVPSIAVSEPNFALNF